ncbi:MAG: hypothetical protein Q7T63_08605 [Burkholderiaceae bacterium]|nr:hypothetical protein [Burkholderiaceae bacterium]
MPSSAITQAAQLFSAAHTLRKLLPGLAAELSPSSADSAHAIQDATVAALGSGVGGWKANLVNGAVTRAPLLAASVRASPARLPVTGEAPHGVEAEIAFRFDRDLPAREAAYSREEIIAAVTAVVVIEVLDTRFMPQAKVTPLDKMADLMSNYALVVGSTPADWRAHDLSKLAVELLVDGEVLTHRVGSHPAVDPLLPAIGLVNVLRSAGGVKAGQIITTGSCTGLHHAQAGQTVIARFESFGEASMVLTRP